MAKAPALSVREALTDASAQLAGLPDGSPRLEAELLLSAASGLARRSIRSAPADPAEVPCVVGTGPPRIYLQCKIFPTAPTFHLPRRLWLDALLDPWVEVQLPRARGLSQR